MIEAGGVRQTETATKALALFRGITRSGLTVDELDGLLNRP